MTENNGGKSGEADESSQHRRAHVVIRRIDEQPYPAIRAGTIDVALRWRKFTEKTFRFEKSASREERIHVSAQVKDSQKRLAHAASGAKVLPARSAEQL